MAGKNSSNKRKRAKKTHTGDGSSYVGLRIVSREEDAGDRGIRRNRLGTIDSFDVRRNLWRVSYDDYSEDGAVEELDHGQVLAAAEIFRDNSDDWYVGRRASRKFGRKIYRGTIDGLDEDDRLWHLTFDDGDEEELEHAELLMALDLYDCTAGSDADVTRRTRTPSRQDAKPTADDADDEDEPVLAEADETTTANIGKAVAAKMMPKEPSTQKEPAKKSASSSDAGQERKGGEKEEHAAPSKACGAAAGTDEGEDAVPSKEGETGAKMTEEASIVDDNPGTRMSSLTVPILVAIIATVIWMCRRMSAISSVDEERLLRSTGLLAFQPDKFQGARRTERYFEGWYYKFVTALEAGDDNDNIPNGATSMAVVPGIFQGSHKNSNESHAFVFVTVNGTRQHYYRFPTSEFTYSSSDGAEGYYVQVGANRFSHAGVTLNLQPGKGDDADLVLRGELSFENPKPWPVSLLRLGAMGPVGWMPFLECTHGVLSFDHLLHGSLTMNSMTRDDGDGRGGENDVPTTSPLVASPSSLVSFESGRGYTEKDFGRSFPSTWIWLQSNSFCLNPGTSLFVSVARVPVFGLGLPGFTAAVWHDGELIPFATWSGARFEALTASDDEVHISMRSGRSFSRFWREGRYRLELTVDRRNVPEVLLYAPVNFTKMAPFVKEALQASVHMRLFDESRGKEAIIDDVGEYAGLEVHGDVSWLVDNVCGKETANRFVCL